MTENESQQAHHMHIQASLEQLASSSCRFMFNDVSIKLILHQKEVI
jgi:hypothetical protein